MAVLGLVVAACGSDRPAAEVRSSSTAPATSSTAPSSLAPTAPSTAAPVVTESSTSVTPAPATSATVATPATPATTSPDRPEALDRAGDAGQAVVVSAAAFGQASATLTTWARTAGAWEQVHGPWPAHIGYAGFAPPGDKREGDGRTPSGTYGFDFAFGIEPDPGVALPYRRVTGPSIVWDDVPSSPSYNLWVEGGVGEAMYQSPVYDHGAVIAYNADRTPGLGSAIFLHVSTGRATAGCVSLPVDRLVEVLRWIDPARSPVIIMGVT